MEKPVVLVTGASAGLGLALAQKLLHHDYRLVLTARESSMQRFEEAGLAEGPDLMLRPLQVRSAADRQALISAVENRWGGVDVLVNNAGVAYRSVVEHVCDDERTRQMEINFQAPMELIRLVLPKMREKRAGHILNVSSVGGMMAMPTMAVYSTSKYALEGASEALWYELRPFNIHVTIVEPGFIRSDSYLKTRLTKLSEESFHNPQDPYHAHYVHMDAMIGKLMKRALATNESVADCIVGAMQRKNPPLRVMATIDGHVFSLLRRFLPRQAFHYFLYFLLPRVDTWGKPE